MRGGGADAQDGTAARTGLSRPLGKACSRMRDVVDMPGRKVTQFILFTRQNNGVFPKAHREKFPELSDAEIAALAAIVREELVNVSERK